MSDGVLSNLELPVGWAPAPLEHVVAEAIGGDWGAPPEEADGRNRVLVSVIRGTEFRNWDKDFGSTSAKRAVDARKLVKRQLKAGDLVLEVSGGGPLQPVGRIALIDTATIKASSTPLICSNFCRRLSLMDSIEPAYGWWALRWLYALGAFDQFQTQTTNLRNLNVTDFLSGVTLPVAPLAEQKRIVAKVEELLARVNAARERLARVPALLKRFRQSVLAAACSGELTADWRLRQRGTIEVQALRSAITQERRERWVKSEITKYRQLGRKPPKDLESRYAVPASLNDDGLQQLPESWIWLRAEEGCDFITKGTTPPSEKMSSGNGEIPYIKVYNLTDRGNLDFSKNPTYIDRATHATGPLARSKVLPGDVLMNLVGPPLGKVSVVPNSFPEWNTNQAVAIYRPVGRC